MATTGKTNTVSPAFQVTQQIVATDPTVDTNGKENLRGLIGSGFGERIYGDEPGGVSLPISVGSATQYQGVTGLAALPAGAPVDLDVATQADGSLLATRVQIENASAWGAWVGPLVVSYPEGTYEEVVPRQWKPNDVTQTYANFPSYFSLTAARSTRCMAARSTWCISRSRRASRLLLIRRWARAYP